MMKYSINWDRLFPLLFQVGILFGVRYLAGFEIMVLLALSSVIVSLMELTRQSASKLS